LRWAFSARAVSSIQAKLIQMKYFLQDEHALIRSAALEVFEKGGHLRLPPQIDLTGGHASERFLEIVGLQVTKEQTILAKKDAIPVPAGLLERPEHLRPNLTMTLAILRNKVWFDLEAESNSRHLSSTS
jgi:hypothetical protein